MRRSSAFRGVFIALLLAGYAWAFHQPGATLTQTFLIGIALQLLIFGLRRFVPAANLSAAMYVFELLVDGATVLLFALGVYGGILHLPTDI
jgi:hypothetical protein